MTAAESALANLQLETGDVEGAIVRYQDLLKDGASKPLARDLRWKLISANVAKRQWPAAKAEIEAILNDVASPPTAAERVAAAMYYRNNGEEPAAQALLSAVLKDDAGAPVGRRRAGADGRLVGEGDRGEGRPCPRPRRDARQGDRARRVLPAGRGRRERRAARRGQPEASPRRDRRGAHRPAEVDRAGAGQVPPARADGRPQGGDRVRGIEGEGRPRRWLREARDRPAPRGRRQRRRRAGDRRAGQGEPDRRRAGRLADPDRRRARRSMRGRRATGPRPTR